MEYGLTYGPDLFIGRGGLSWEAGEGYGKAAKELRGDRPKPRHGRIPFGWLWG